MVEKTKKRLKETYKRYKHLDRLLSDREWLGLELKDQILFELWQAIKSEIEK